ncbi:hypothetical protein GCM10020256_61760 [Streptomyces thermocoprophilus]
MKATETTRIRGVAAGFAVGAQLFQVEPGDVVEAGLLGEFTPGGGLGGLVGQQEPAGQCPLPGVGLLAAPDEQDVQGARAQGEDREVDGDGEGLVGVLVVALDGAVRVLVVSRHDDHPLSWSR